MKNKLLISMCLFLTLSTAAFAAQPQGEVNNAEVKQKACQNIFSLINIDLSLMSPRGTAADVSMSGLPTQNPPCPCKKDNIVPISDRRPMPCDKKCPQASGMHPVSQIAPPDAPKPPMPQQNKTSLFRLDLLHLFKIQIL